MIAEFVVVMAVSKNAAAPPSSPTGASLATYGASLVQVNWTNGNSGTKQTRIYRSSFHGSWVFRATVAAGAASYQTADSAASNYTYGVSHYDPVTGLESAIRTAVDLPPDPPTNFSTYTYGTKIGCQWTNTESMEIRCYRNGVFSSTKPAGTTSWDSGYTSGTLSVTHYNSSTGQESDFAGGGL